MNRHQKTNSQKIVKIERKNDITYVHRENGDINLMVAGGKDCKHFFAAFGQGFDGNYYYFCITGGGCRYRKKLTAERVKELKNHGLLD